MSDSKTARNKLDRPVRRVGRFTSEDIHNAVFPDGPPKPHTHPDIKEGIRGYINERHSANKTAEKERGVGRSDGKT
jgi:hypothetical protein